MSQSTKKNGKCRWFNQDGTPTRGGCRRATQDCVFLHPDEPGWATARGWTDNRGGGVDAPTRGSFNTEQRNNDTGWSTRSKHDFIPGGSQSKPATTESGWIAWDAPASASGTTDAWGEATSWADKKDEPLSAGNKFAWGQTVSSSSKNIEEKSVDAWGQAIGGSGSGWDSVKSPEPSAGGWGSGWNDTTSTRNEDQQSAAVDAWGGAIKPTDGGWGSWGADQSSGKNSTSAAAGGWGNAASAPQDLAHDTLTGSTWGAWNTGEDAGNTGRGTDTDWGEKGKDSASTWSQSASGTLKPLDAMDTSNAISGIDAWGSHHAAASSRVPDIVHGSISGLRDPDCQDSASSVTRVSRSEQSKQGSDRDNHSTHHSNLTVPVPQYEIPAHEMSSIHILFVAAVDATQDLDRAEADYKTHIQALQSRVYREHDVPLQVRSIIESKKMAALTEVTKARHKNSVYLDALEKFQSTPGLGPVDAAPDEQETVNYLLGQVTPWLNEQDQRIQQAHARLDKLLDSPEGEDQMDVSTSASAVSKRQRVLSPEMEAQIQARREAIDADDQVLVSLMEHLDMTFSSQLEDLVTAELEKFRPEEGQVVQGTLESAEQQCKELVKAAEGLATSFDEWQEDEPARTDAKSTLSELEGRINRACADFDQQRALTDNAWKELEGRLTGLEGNIQQLASQPERVAAAIATGETRIRVDDHFKEHVEPAFKTLEIRLSARFQSQLSEIMKAVEEYVVPAERWLAAHQARPSASGRSGVLHL